ncbi:MAG: hypothetical protein VB144_09085 [Clostridia bacterium]|nr:hypothetical protein [Clostridia bacterium]
MNWGKGLVCVLAAVLIAAVGTGCGRDRILPGGSGSVAMAANIKRTPAAAGDPKSIVVDLTMAGFNVRREFPLNGDSAAGTVESLTAGIWQVNVAAIDDEGDAIYAAKTKADVKRDTVASVQVTLKAVDGRVRIEASPQGLPQAESALAADISVYYSGGSSAYRSYKDIAKQGSVFVVEDTGYVPRSYDMRIVFKGQDGTSLYETEYVGFGVCPGKTTTVSWLPGLGSIGIQIGLMTVPRAPEGVAVAMNGQKAMVSWRPEPGDGVASYRVYWRYSQFDRYMTSRSEPVEAPALQVEVSLSASQKGSMVYFVVVAKDSLGQESLRSEEISVAYN